MQQATREGKVKLRFDKKHVIMRIVELKPSETLAIRHAVLWPNKHVGFCKVEGDDKAKHFGVLKGDDLVCVASVFFNIGAEGQKIARLRKFATLSEFQGLGVGSFMFEHVVSFLINNGVDFMWFDARESATTFYNRFGFQHEGARFYKSGVPYFKMSRHF